MTHDSHCDAVMRECFRWWVSGRVQGVGFRFHTRARAESLGLDGHAFNRPDGGVEVLACGPPDAVEALCRWLHDGPDHAYVTRVECERVEEACAPGFRLG